MSLKLKRAPISYKRILVSVDFMIVVQACSLSKDDPFFHAQKDRYLMGLPTPSLFAPSEHLIGGCRINAMFTGERLN
ncbi:hypothetical protein FBY10_107129 [Pseudomonas sp. SJZ103]|nr:hypothetical protein FBY10_107129 [Pseudomonas sp. SJZ103]TWC84902.1 hypothetical protein FBY08_107129 [Pseudomonas sp. SJZ094]